MPQTKRRLVFQGAGEGEPADLDPPMKAQDDFDDLVGGEEESEQPIPELAPEEGSKEPIPENGWQLLSLEQQTGKFYIVTNDTTQEGVRAFWRKTRALSHFRWVLNGKWCDVLTNQYLIPQPIYFKEIR